MKQLTLEMLGNRETIRDNAKRSNEVFAIPLEKIVTRRGFNVRHGAVSVGDVLPIISKYIK